jgi:tetratricopeptide (TPR) repeat protein
MDEGAAAKLLELARADPRHALEQAEKALSGAPLDDAVASIVLRAMGDAARWVRTIAASVDWLEQAVQRARSAGRPDLVREAQLTLAGSYHLGGDLAAALRTLDTAAAGASPDMLAKIEFQRATIMAREGQTDAALHAFDLALTHFEAVGDQRFAALTLGNRGMVNLERGYARAATVDLERAQQGFRRLGIAASVAWMEHNLGRAAGARGDVVGALSRFRRSENELLRLTESTWEVQVNRCEVLLQAGLFAEAEGVAAQAERAMATAGLALDRAEAVLSRSLALLGQGSHAAAAEQAQRAASLFLEQRRETRALQAQVVELRSRLAAGSRVDVPAAISIARRLNAAGRHVAAAQAWAVVAHDEPGIAVKAVGELPLPRRDAPLEFRLTELEILARARLASGDRSGALGATRSAVQLVRRHQLTLGASDIRAAISSQLDSITQLGLTLRRELKRPWSVLRWVDDSRAASLHSHWGAPTGEDEIGDLLAELRAIQVAARTVDPAESLDLLQRQASVQRRLAAAQRLAAAAGQRSPPHLPRQLSTRFADVTVVQHHRHGDHLSAVVADRSGSRVVDLASLAEISTAHDFLAHALGRLVLGRDGALDAVDRDAKALSELVVPSIDGRPTVVVPLPQHTGLPWSLLPALRDRPVTIAPNLRHWLRPAASLPSPIRRIGLVEGSELATGHREIAGIARIWSEPTTLSTRDGGVDATLGLLSRVDVAHLACHGRRRKRDGRFAHLRLPDGDLTAFDLERLPRAPSLVVLSACESGLIDALPGEESAGLTTALFGRGTDSVIASTILLPDTSSTAELFIDLHRRLAGGRPAAAALFEAQQACADPHDRAVAQSVSCFGRG